MLILLTFSMLVLQDDMPSPHGTTLIGWWTNQTLCQEWKISDSQLQELTKTLENFQISYQVQQNKLNQARKEQSGMFLDPKVNAADLAKFNQENVADPSSQMQDINFKARLFVRESLSADQLALIQAKNPGFFSAKWFQGNRQLQVGKVVQKK